MSIRYCILVVTLLLTATFMPESGYAQDKDDDTCPDMVQSVLTQLGNNCANLDRNHACYGTENVEITYFEDFEGEETAVSSDELMTRTDLSEIQSIRTGTDDAESDTWNAAIINIQGNLPHNVASAPVFVLIGDLELISNVAPEEALILTGRTLTVNVPGDIDLLSAPNVPGFASEVIYTAPSNSILLVDGISSDGQWLRIPFQLERRAFLWGNREALMLPIEHFQEMPIIDHASRGPMQSFTLLPGTDASECSEFIPPLVYIQGPNGIEFDLTINSFDIHFASSVVLSFVPDPSSPSGFSLRILVTSGIITLYPGTPNEMLVPPGFAIQAPLGFDDDGNPIIAGIFTDPSPVGSAELEALSILEGLPGNLLNIPPYIPTVIVPSGVGQPIPIYGFDDPESALASVREMCANGDLPDDTCAALLQGDFPGQ